MQRISAADVRRVLCLGAHCDDIEIGCGGTILRLTQERPGLEVLWVVFSSTAVRAQEAKRAAELFLAGAAVWEVVIRDYRDGFLPYLGSEVKQYVETLKSFQPDVILTHTLEDRHQDHRVIGELTWNTFRDHLILEYEVVKYDGDFGRPNVYVPLTEDLARRKAQSIVDVFGSQERRDWFRADTFLSVARLRGIECRSESGYAEAFVARKLVL